MVGESVVSRAAVSATVSTAFCQTEVEEFDRTVRPDLDVLRLQIAMDDARGVRRLEPVGDLARDPEGVIDFQPACELTRLAVAISGRNEAVERHSLDQLHHERRCAGRALQPVDLGDVRMIEGGQHFCLTLESQQPIRIAGERWRQDFEGDIAFQVQVGRQVDLAHAPFAQQRANSVGTDGVADHGAVPRPCGDPRRAGHGSVRGTVLGPHCVPSSSVIEGHLIRRRVRIRIWIGIEQVLRALGRPVRA